MGWNRRRNGRIRIDDGESVNVGGRYRVGGSGGETKKWEMRGW